MIDNKKCFICNKGKGNDTLYWHIDAESKSIFCWCAKCARGYSINDYCHKAGIELNEFLKGDFHFIESKPNEVNALTFPHSFITLHDPRAKEGVDYLAGRGISTDIDAYYDSDNHGIVFPLHYDNVFAGAQIRLIEPWIDKEGNVTKMISMPGTRIGLLVHGWNQGTLPAHIKGIIITEGPIDAISIQQGLNMLYGGVAHNPFKVVAVSGSGGCKHHLEIFKELRDRGIKVILASDSDSAGLKMLKKFNDANTITHYMITGNSEKDWNKMLVEIGDKKEFGSYCVKLIKAIK